jgi:hypothetical protein
MAIDLLMCTLFEIMLIQNQCLRLNIEIQHAQFIGTFKRKRNKAKKNGFFRVTEIQRIFWRERTTWFRKTITVLYYAITKYLT